MKKEDVKVGMKVVPHSKTGICPTPISSYQIGDYSPPSKFLKENGFLFVAVDKGENNFLLNENLSENGDFFLAEDFEPFVEPSVKTSFSIEDVREAIEPMTLINKSELIRLQDIEKKYRELTELLLKNAMDSLALYERLKV